MTVTSFVATAPLTDEQITAARVLCTPFAQTRKRIMTLVKKARSQTVLDDHHYTMPTVIGNWNSMTFRELTEHQGAISWTGRDDHPRPCHLRIGKVDSRQQR